MGFSPAFVLVSDEVCACAQVLEEDEYHRRKGFYLESAQRHYYFMNVGNGEVIDACRKVGLVCVHRQHASLQQRHMWKLKLLEWLFVLLLATCLLMPCWSCHLCRVAKAILCISAYCDQDASWYSRNYKQTASMVGLLAQMSFCAM